MSDHATGDFETYSEAGHVWNADVGKWKAPAGARDKGLRTVGAVAYSQHPSTEVLTMSYRLPLWWAVARGLPLEQYLTATGLAWRAVRIRWKPGEPNPQELFDYLAAGGAFEAHNVMFERLIWENVCVPKYGWPSLEPYRYQLRCSMAKARVNALPGPLGNLGAVLNLSKLKDKDGKRLLDKFSVPRDPTKKDPRWRITPAEEPVEAERLYSYCDDDIESEEEASGKMHPMSQDEHEFWLIDQEINWRGVAIDRAGVRDCIAVLEQALDQYGDEFRALTGFNPTQLAEVRGWLHARGVHLESMDEKTIDAVLDGAYASVLPDDCRRALEIRQLIGSASVKKLYAMEHQASALDRLCNLIMHHGARTGRPTGEGPQPLNLPKAGPDLKWCGMGADGKWLEGFGCRRPFKTSHTACPWCAAPVGDAPKREWSAEAVDSALQVMATRNLAYVEWYFGDALYTISGCVRGLFVAGPGHDLIASDYSAIEAVVTAMLAKCQWRIDAFREKKPIYLLSASLITGTPLQEYLDYNAAHGSHHPDRQKIGKVNELANGFGGWIGASKAFGSKETDAVIKAQILAWRAASPEIVEMWGGQTRRGDWRAGEPTVPELYGFEGMAISAIKWPGYTFEHAGIQFYMRGDALIVRLLSGRELTYHQPRLIPATKEWSKAWEVSIVYMTWNTNPKYGPMGWVPMSTYGGRLTENIVQAIAHDILRDAIKRLRLAGYPTVLHVYDEIVVEVPHGLGSIEEVERIMSTMPWWCADWPVSASGGWRGWRYRKA